MPDTFAATLLNWFDLHGRKNLPWQQNINAYRVWVSEIMLQQTQVTTVIPYYQRFMQRFPDAASLSAAALDDVLHLWTGLGYYARARNLHKTAQQIVEVYQGEFPNSVEALQNLPGIGRSTAGAICAIAFNQQATILDGNVKRVLARYHAIGGWPGKTAVSKLLWEKAEEYTPGERTADYTQAIMDLGATLCTRSKPDCPGCPLQQDCIAFRQKRQSDFPGSKPKKTQPVKNILLLIMRNNRGQVLLEKRPATGIWGGLWSFPECGQEGEIAPLCLNYGLKVKSWQSLPQQRHTFSHFHLDYRPTIVETEQQSAVMDTPPLIWHDPDEPLTQGTATPIKNLLTEITQY